jgi:hypothetical protein
MGRDDDLMMQYCKNRRLTIAEQNILIEPRFNPQVVVVEVVEDDGWVVGR